MILNNPVANDRTEAEPPIQPSLCKKNAVYVVAYEKEAREDPPCFPDRIGKIALMEYRAHWPSSATLIALLASSKWGRGRHH